MTYAGRRFELSRDDLDRLIRFTTQTMEADKYIVELNEKLEYTFAAVYEQKEDDNRRLAYDNTLSHRLKHGE